MIKHYLLTAWRHIVGSPLFSFINIFGLTVALASCTLIILFVQQELSHDRHLPNADRIVRLHSAYRPSDAPEFLTVRSAGRMMRAISDYAPDLVENGVRLLQVGPTVRVGEKIFSESMVFADGSFFDVFELPFAAGDAKSGFAKPGDLIIDEATAVKYFDLDWREFVTINQQFFRPTDIAPNRGDPTPANQLLGWETQFFMKDVVNSMRDATMQGS